MSKDTKASKEALERKMEQKLLGKLKQFVPVHLFDMFWQRCIVVDGISEELYVEVIEQIIVIILHRV